MLVNFPVNVVTVHDAFNSVVEFEILPKEFFYDSILVPLLGVESSEEQLE